MRPLPIIADEESAALFQSPVQMYDGNAIPAWLLDDAIAGLKNEAANFAHRPILRYWRKVWHAALMPRSGKALLDLFLRPGGKGSRSRRPLPAAGNPGIQAIWEVVCTIPRGQVSTYGAVARAAGLPGRARLAGFALRMAPDEMNLPWHRVLGAGGRIVFPRSSPHFREQAKRLKAEGVRSKDGRVDSSRIADLFNQGGH
jgi:methylated-DNA-protein-cysteine methyltransferase-like protein